jgi:hypothetical protein
MDITTISNFFTSLTPTQWIIAIVVAVMLAKKLVKVAIVIGLLVFVAFPLIKSSGVVNFNIDKDGIMQQILQQIGL